MAKIVIEGGRTLNGEVWASGSKNAVLPILAGAILSGKTCHISNVPHLQDVTTTIELLGRMGGEVVLNERMQIEVNCSTINEYEAPYDLVKTMRA